MSAVQPARSWHDRALALRPTLSRGDVAALAWSALFLGWLVFDWLGESWAPHLGFLFFAPLGLVVGVLNLRVASLLDDPRERIAWRILAASALIRFASGNVWGLWIIVRGRGPVPEAVLVLGAMVSLLWTLALLTFPSADARPVDRSRYRFDSAIVLVGSALVAWFFALGPFIRATGETAAGALDYVVTINDALTVVLAAALHLRGRSHLTRTVGLLLLATSILQVIPDIVLWSERPVRPYAPGDPVDGVWYAVWAFKWLAARYALVQLRKPGGTARDASVEYRGSWVPYGFLAGATAVLFLKLLEGSKQESTIFLFGSGALAALLVARQMVEARERDRLDQSQIAEAAWYRALLHHAYDFVLLVDADGRATYVSPATADLLGDADSLGLPWGFIARLHPSDAPRLRAAIAQSASGAPVTLACRARDATGGWRELSLRLQDLTADPLVRAVVINGHDRTREARLAQRLKESHDVEALGIFAGGLAHDLNNILTVIGSHANLLESEPALPRQARADLKDISVATKRAATLTRGLLALSRRKSAPRETIDVDVLVRERADAQHATREWPVALDAQVRTVRADRLSISQMVDALLDNAAAHGDAATEIAISSCVVSAEAAHTLEVDPGTYVVLRFGHDAPARATTRTARALLHTGTAWDASPDDLGMLMAYAAVRELGGTLTLDTAHPERSVSVYLPAAVA